MVRTRRRSFATLLLAALAATGCGAGGAYRDAERGGTTAPVVVTSEAATPGAASVATDASSGDDPAGAGADSPGPGAPATPAPDGGEAVAGGAPGRAPAGAGGGGRSEARGAASSGSAPDRLPPAAPQRGLTADTIKLGFVKLGSWQNLGANFGVVAIDWGDVDAQLAVLVDWVNATGGIAGRRVEYVLAEYKQEEASAQAEAQICNRFVDDEGVWGVVLQGQIHFSTRACYTSRGVVVLDPSPFSFDDDMYAEQSPWLFSPSTPSLTRVVRALAESLHERSWFAALASRGETATRLGVVMWDDPYAKRVYETDLLPVLTALGHDVAMTHAIDNADAGTIQNGITNGIVRFRSEGINRVVFVGGNPIAPLWFLNAEQHGYAPRYGLTTFDGPAHTTDQTPSQMRDALGIGFNAVHDVRDAQYAFPSDNPVERRCLDVLREGGQEFAARRSAEIALAYCESLLLLQAGADGLGDALDGPRWAERVERLGTSFRSAVGFGNAFGRDRHDGGAAYRLTEHRADCSCFHYVGGSRRFS